MVYDENYSVYENKILNDINYAKGSSFHSVYNDFDGNMVVNYLSRKTIRMSIMCTDDNRVFLYIDGKDIKLTPPIALRCQQMLYEYKTKKLGENKQDLTYDYYKGLVDTEQMRDIYKLCNKFALQKHLFTKQVKSPIIFVPAGIKIDKKERYYCNLEVSYKIGYSKLKRKIAKILFNKGKGASFTTDDLNQKRGDDGKYHLCVNGNDFSFLTIEGLNSFASLLDSWCRVELIRHVDDYPIIFRYKARTSKICNLR